jgi:hypothetical protein
MQAFITVVWSTLLTLVSTGCMTAHVLPPRAAPPSVMPAVAQPAEQPQAQYGRVVIDATDGPMDVTAQRNEPFAGTGNAPSGSAALCRTPCVRDIPVGHYDLFFSGLAQDESRGDRAAIDVREGVNVLLRAPGKYETPRAFQPGPLSLVFGGLVVGVAGVAGGAAIDGGAGSAVIVTSAVVGIGMLVAGLVIYDYRAEQQDGTSTYFHAALSPAANSGNAASPLAATTDTTETRGQ